MQQHGQGNACTIARFGHFSRQHFLAVLPVRALVFAAKKRANLGAGRTRDQKAIGFHQPVAARQRLLGSHNLHLLAVLQLRGQRHHAPVHFRAAATVAKVRVELVSEVERRGTGRQFHDVAAGAEHIDALGEQLRTELVEEVPFTGAARGE